MGAFDPTPITPTIDPTDGNVVAYERCGAGASGGAGGGQIGRGCA